MRKAAGVAAIVTGLALASVGVGAHHSHSMFDKVFMDERGRLNERLPGDPLYWDATEARPWGAWLTESDKRYAQYRRTQGR